tara:strand:- start:4200 stop:4406 length:207 start_codon:yes stop_codon:yes gene_type:complete
MKTPAFTRRGLVATSALLDFSKRDEGGNLTRVEVFCAIEQIEDVCCKYRGEDGYDLDCLEYKSTVLYA